MSLNIYLSILQVEIEILRKELQQKQELLKEAAQAMNHMEEIQKETEAKGQAFIEELKQKIQFLEVSKKLINFRSIIKRIIKLVLFIEKKKNNYDYTITMLYILIFYLFWY